MYFCYFSSHFREKWNFIYLNIYVWTYSTIYVKNQKKILKLVDDYYDEDDDDDDNEIYHLNFQKYEEREKDKKVKFNLKLYLFDCGVICGNISTTTLNLVGIYLKSSKSSSSSSSTV